MKLNNKIVHDIENIKNDLNNILHKNYQINSFNKSCCKDFESIYKDIKLLSKRLQKRERQKQHYTKKFKEITKNQSDIISAISHEFKNPVAAIVGYTQTIYEDDLISKEMRKRFLLKVLSNANKISTMIDRLSLTIKLENKKITPRFSEFGLKSLVEEVKETLLQKYKDREILIDILDDVYIRADRVMFENLLINLVENALKYSESEVIISLHDSYLEVIDKGIGIDSENLEKLTKKFFRVNSLSWDNSIGVGLYIARYILKLHDSELKVESKINKGSKFYFSVENLLKGK